MNTVLITHSYYYKFDRKQWRFKQPYPPLGTLLAAAVVRELGFPVTLFDSNLAEGPEQFGEKIRRHPARYVIIYDDGFNYLTKMCLTNMREAAFEMAKVAKKHGCTVIVCSSDASDHYEKYFPHGVDFVVRGEGEETLKELLPVLEKRGDLSQVNGLAYKNLGKTVLNEPRKVLKDLDGLPFPAWDLLDIAPYRRIWKKYHGYFSLNIATTRGCPFKCNWCAKPIYGNRYNSRSPENVVREIEMLLEKFQPDHFWICDDIFGLKPGWVEQFRDLVSAKKLRFRYKIQSRADLLLEEKIIDALTESGAEMVWIGAESGSQKILDAMDKGITVEQIRHASGLLRQKNVQTGFFLQFGYLGENLQDIEATIRMVLELMPDDLGISVSYPLPGTKFYEKVKSQLNEKKNWTDSDDLSLMFENTFNKEYYRQLHRFVHSLYRKKKGYNILKKIGKNPFALNSRDLKSGLSAFYYLPVTISRQIRLKKLATAQK
ncbi:MAG TPA: radical SAM protein [Chryseosolibacter sp.]